MDLGMFANTAMGQLVPIEGEDVLYGRWSHKAFVAAPLPHSLPGLSPQSYLAVADARAALSALDSTARQLPNPRLFRIPALKREAQSTSELEGTYAPFAEVLIADEESPATTELREILNYVAMADYGFQMNEQGRSLTPGVLAELQGILMRSLPRQKESGRIRSTQVVVGRQPGMPSGTIPIHASRFVPVPPGIQLETGVSDLLDWTREDHRGQLDPVMVAGLAHYQFETLHPFTDGNGRLGRFLIVLQLLSSGVLSEPTLTVSPWFEARRTEYYDHLLRVSTHGDWSGFLTFFANGIQHAAVTTQREMLNLARVQEQLHSRVRESALRADTVHSVIDFAVANPTFTIGKVQQELNVSYGRAHKIINQLVELGILQVVDSRAFQRRYFAPDIMNILTGSSE